MLSLKELFALDGQALPPDLILYWQGGEKANHSGQSGTRGALWIALQIARTSYLKRCRWTALAIWPLAYAAALCLQFLPLLGLTASFTTSAWHRRSRACAP